ncbi:Hemerythrin HHE cation binding domain-containing protein [Thermomonospora echinospora]|uniref:Hemerythrin HHE cation binding domain-containing protein n=1 Tax=Thermomonospora echinospora TaxID=1992 RepID=A0A1H5T0F6_9ACTN|nr:hemerythrin domain-containing protein [Thermomonospora echinospora]SEF55527.1 Hemerythrin HHE cation binding domain-containing protein [Thermomonospora echinospora]
MSAEHNDVVDLLLRQHEQIHELFFQVQDRTGDERRDAFRRLVRLLAVHETAEEEIVHPLVRRTAPDGERVVADRLAEEREGKEILASLDGMDIDDPAFLAGLKDLREAVLRHARAEEKHEFPLVREKFGDAERRAMAVALKAAEATAPTHPHPGTESAKRNLLAGPAVAVFDRTRDLVSGALSKVGR